MVCGLAERVLVSDCGAMSNNRGDADDQVVLAEVAGNPLIEQVGPFFDTQALCNKLRLSSASLRKLADDRTLLACQDSDGNLYWPAWQFTADMKPLPSLRRVLQLWQETQMDGWSIGQWLTVPLGALDGATACDWLRAGYPIEPLLEAARRQATRDRGDLRHV